MTQIEKPYKLRKNGNGLVLRTGKAVLESAEITKKNFLLYQDGRDLIIAQQLYSRFVEPGKTITFLGTYSLSGGYIRIPDSFCKQFSIAAGVAMGKYVEEQIIDGNSRRIVRLKIES